jgi:hypothetical protein
LKQKNAGRRHTIRRYIPTLMDSAATLRLVLEALEDIAEKIDPRSSSKNKYPGTDLPGAQALKPIVDDLYKHVFALGEITGDDFIERMEKFHDGVEASDADDESEVQPAEVK